MRRSNNKNRIKVYRTMEGNIFEAVTAVLLIIIWILTFKELGAGGNIAAATTAADGEGAGKILIPNIAVTAATLLLLVSAYFPDRMINLDIKIRNTAQYALVIRMVRVLALETAVMFLGCNAITGFADKIFPVTLPVVLFATIFIFRFLINRKA